MLKSSPAPNPKPQINKQKIQPANKSENGDMGRDDVQKKQKKKKEEENPI